MVRTEIPTTYGQLQVDDTIWLDDQPHRVMYLAGRGNVWTVKDPQGNRHNLVQADSDPVYRSAR